jgi:tetratricopeptide (TPR) repeat protein
MRARSLLFTLLAGFGFSSAFGQFTVPKHPPVSQPSPGCGNFNYEKTALGPLDYRITPPDEIEFVEVRHFPSHVERLQRGEKGTVGGDIAYTLRSFPNHPRALRSAAEWQRRHNGLLPPDMQFTAACWFDRAIAFRPDDAQVRVVLAFELLKSKKSAAAIEQVSKAEQLAKGNPQIHYNVGLLYFELKEYDKSMANARIAYEQGFDLPGLKDKLVKAGKWSE